VTYALIDVVFLVLACLVLAAVSTARLRQRDWPGLPFWRPVLAGGAVLMALTAAFDSVMIALGLFGYRPDALSGVFVGLAPIEDFAYPLAAAVVLPALWRRLNPAPSTAKGDT
jgi:lycopene cyclase domain-containing protein